MAQIQKLWDNINDNDFFSDTNVDDENLATYNLEKMKIFSANINYFRQIIRLSDSLKPSERRILYSMYTMGAVPGSKTRKSNEIVGNTMKIHSHGSGAIYATLVNMAQGWKRSVPLIRGKGNFGIESHPDLYAQDRYTEALISKYAYECFFSDYDDACVQLIENTAIDGFEPASLPAKFPNILVNGGVGIAIGNAFRIPPYNINDVIALCKRLLQNPDHPDIYILPDLPTGCSIIDSDNSLRSICDTGEGVLRMRADIEILERPKTWVLQVRNTPWMTSLTNIDDKIVELTKAGKLPIKEVQDDSYPIKINGDVFTKIDYRIVIDKAHDPNKIREKLYKTTELEKSVSVNFKVVLEGLTIDRLNMRDLVLSWIDERREYKRRLLNKKISRISARISLLEIMIRLLDSDNIEKTVTIVRTSNGDELVDRLRKHGNMNSYQATKVAEMRLNAFTKDSREKYVSEKNKLVDELADIMLLIRSEKRIDKLISEELDDLKKYAKERKSKILSDEHTNTKISNTDHKVIVTKQGLIKKITHNPKDTRPVYMGTFKQYDYPISIIDINNLDSIIFYDSLGKYSNIPVHSIDNTENTNPGNKLYDYTKLDGDVIACYQGFTKDTEKYVKDKLNDTMCLVTLSKDGNIKKTPLEEFTKIKNTRNVRAMKLRGEDKMVAADLILDSSIVIVYTKKGSYAMISMSELTPQNKDTIGLKAITLDEGDECVGLSVLGVNDTDIMVLTEKGLMKRCSLEFMHNGGKRKTNASYICTIDANDAVFCVDSINKDSIIKVITRMETHQINYEDIVELSRKAKAQKLIPMPVGNNIIMVDIK